VSYLEERQGEGKGRKSRNLLRSTRPRRVVYSHMCNFRVTDPLLKNPDVKSLVPEESLPEALLEAEKRGLLGESFQEMKALFEDRPVWTKGALEWRSKGGKYSLKYLLPCLAYFSLNGPWRSCWIRLGYDPRRDKGAFVYQLLDYRLPGE
jgi:hypothetical protein